MRAVAIVHDTDAGPGVFLEAAHEAGWTLEYWTAPLEPAPQSGTYDAVMTFGGSVHPDEEHRWLELEREFLRSLLEREVPVLAVCLGAQLLASAAGAPVRRMASPEIGWYEVKLTDAGRMDPVMAGLSPSFCALQWHTYDFLLPEGAIELARSDSCIQAFRWGQTAWGVQFHPEVTRDDFEDWVYDYESDRDAVSAGPDPVALLAETQPRIGSWHEVGREICTRFLEVARPSRRSAIPP